MVNRGHKGAIISHNINQTRGAMYKSARILGDIQAFTSPNPYAIEKRLVRRLIGRSLAKTLWRHF